MKKTVNPEIELRKDEAAQVAAENRAVSLNAAATLLLTMLSEPVRLMLTETAATTLSIPLWQLVVGLLQQSYDLGLFTTPQLDPDWSNNLPSRPAVFKEAICQNPACKKQFAPRWPKQEFCSNECGIAYQRSCAALGDRQYMVGGKHPLGQEPSASPTSALHPPVEDQAVG